MLGKKKSLSASIAVWLADRGRITRCFDILDAWYLEQQQLGSNYDYCHEHQVDSGTITWLLSPICCSAWRISTCRSIVSCLPVHPEVAGSKNHILLEWNVTQMHISWLSKSAKKGYWLPLTGFLCQFRVSTYLLVYLKGNWLLPQRQTRCCMLTSKLQCLGLDFCSWELDKKQN